MLKPHNLHSTQNLVTSLGAKNFWVLNIIAYGVDLIVYVLKKIKSHCKLQVYIWSRFKVLKNGLQIILPNKLNLLWFFYLSYLLENKFLHFVFYILKILKNMHSIYTVKYQQMFSLVFEVSYFIINLLLFYSTRCRSIKWRQVWNSQS